MPHLEQDWEEPGPHVLDHGLGAPWPEAEVAGAGGAVVAHAAAGAIAAVAGPVAGLGTEARREKGKTEPGS